MFKYIYFLIFASQTTQTHCPLCSENMSLQRKKMSRFWNSVVWKKKNIKNKINTSSGCFPAQVGFHWKTKKSERLLGNWYCIIKYTKDKTYSPSECFDDNFARQLYRSDFRILLIRPAKLPMDNVFKWSVSFSSRWKPGSNRYKLPLKHPRTFPSNFSPFTYAAVIKQQFYKNWMAFLLKNEE